MSDSGAAAWDSWQWSEAQKQEIRDALADDLPEKVIESVIRKLRGAILVTDVWQRHYSQPRTAPLRKQAQKTAAAARKLRQELGELYRLAGAGEHGATADYLLDEPKKVIADKLDLRPGPGARWMRDLAELEKRLENMTDDDSKPKPGPPPDVDTESLHRQIAGILNQHGVPITKYRAGAAARILTLCHQAATGAKLKDPFRALAALSKPR